MEEKKLSEQELKQVTGGMGAEDEIIVVTAGTCHAICRNCMTTSIWPGTKAGQTVECPNCGNPVTIPGEAAIR